MSPAAKQIVSQITGVLIQAANPKQIILFGSQARDAAADSDFDIMVVSDENYQYWRNTPGNVYFEAATAGQVLY